MQSIVRDIRPCFNISSFSTIRSYQCFPSLLRLKLNNVENNNLPKIQIRYQSSHSEKISEPINEEKSKNSSNPKFSEELKRIVTLAYPERYMLSLAIVLLFISSAITMSVPFSMGRIIDLVMKGLGAEVSPDNLNESSTFQGLFNSSSGKIAIQPESERSKKPQKSDVSLPIIFGGLAVVFTIGGLANTGRVILIRLAGEKVVKRLRIRLFSSIIKQDTAFFDRNRTGELISRLSSDTNIVGKAITQNLSDGLRSTTTAVVGLGMMLYVNPFLTVDIEVKNLIGTMMAIIPPVALGAIWYGRLIRVLSRQTQDAFSETSKVAEERLGNLRTVRAFSQEISEISRYANRVENIYNLAKREAYASGFFFGGMGLSGNLVMLSILWYGGSMVAAGDITVGELTSFFLYTAYVGSSMVGLSGFYSELMKGVGASSRVFALLESKPLIEQSDIVKRLKPTEVTGRIEVAGVKFAYPTRPDARIFNDLNFTIEPGTSVAIVGNSGSGKSSIALLLLRFYDPEAGKIFIDGKNIKDLDPQWIRENMISMVSQEPVIFAGTIAENIAYGRPDASRKEIIEAAKKANALNFIESFPDGFDTYVGERGTAVSGGQKQRIAIARALIKSPSILVLDEASSALDAASERSIQDALDRVVAGRNITTVVIAHRLSTIMKADKILMIEGGKIVEAGTFSELIALGGKFSNLVRQQQIEVAKSEN
ncbi:ATP-binding cassette sub- B member 10, mitochondrial [Nowakowskiella sp. JEL0078]|nr:ATP-binding cassette sub- B member 10, mitochondrial [Nowakowskiella sp. JEL0078]